MTIPQVLTLLSSLLLMLADGYCSDSPQSSPEKPNSAVMVKGSSINVLDYGFDEADSTRFIQAAINSKAKTVVLPNVGKPWLTRPLTLRSDLKLVLEKGAILKAKKGSFLGTNDSLLTIKNCRNVTIRGGGPQSLIVMRKEDYAQPPYKDSEWRHAIQMFNSRNILIEDVSITRSGGDGIYIGAPACQDVTIRRVQCLEHHRQGISVISVKGLLIEDCELSDTHGTPPAAGIDFEPNRHNQLIQDAVLRNVTARNNAGAGFLTYLSHRMASSPTYSVRFEKCFASGNGKAGFLFCLPVASQKGQSKVSMESCVTERNCVAGLAFQGPQGKGDLVEVKNCSFELSNGAKTDTGRVLMMASNPHVPEVGGVVFENVKVGGTKPLEYRVTALVKSFEANCGQITTVDGKVWDVATVPRPMPNTDDTPVIEYDGKYCLVSQKDFPERLRRLPSSSETPFFRHGLEAVFWAERGKDVKLVFDYQQVAQLRDWGAKAFITTPSNKVTSLPKLTFKGKTPVVFKPAETGLHRISASVPKNKIRLYRTDGGGLSILAKNGAVRVYRAQGSFFVFVPGEVLDFSFHLIPDDTSETSKVTIFNGKGKPYCRLDYVKSRKIVRVNRPDDGRKRANEVWEIRLDRPTKYAWDDFGFEIRGVPPLLATSPNGLLQPQK